MPHTTNRKLHSIRPTTRLSCIWLRTTDPQAPLTCVWQSARTPNSAPPPPNEEGVPSVPASQAIGRPSRRDQKSRSDRRPRRAPVRQDSL